jgi:hypothetical protein
LAAAGRCFDTLPTPPIADILCTDANNGTIVVSGQYQKGEQVIIGAASGSCLPDTLACTVASPEGLLAQTVEIDSSCDGGQQLILKENYGAFTSVGFSCDATDRNNCLIDVIYDLEVCNRGTEEECIYEWNFIMNETIITDLTVGLEDVCLLTDECLEAVVIELVDRCAETEYCAEATANATNPQTGIPLDCDDEEEIKFGFQVIPVPPTEPPT